MSKINTTIKLSDAQRLKKTIGKTRLVDTISADTWAHLRAAAEPDIKINYKLPECPLYPRVGVVKPVAETIAELHDWLNSYMDAKFHLRVIFISDSNMTK